MLREAIIFGPKMTQKRFFTGKPFLTGKYIFHVPLHPFQRGKSWHWPKVNFGIVKQTIKEVLKVLLFLLHVKSIFQILSETRWCKPNFKIDSSKRLANFISRLNWCKDNFCHLMLGSSNQKHSTNYVLFSHDVRLLFDKIEVPFPIYTNMHHISCGISSGISGKYFVTLMQSSA